MSREGPPGAPMRVPNIVLESDRSRVLCRATLGLVVYFKDDGFWEHGGVAETLRAFVNEVGAASLPWCATSLAPDWFTVREHELKTIEEQLSLPWARRTPRHLFGFRLADEPPAPSLEFAYRASDCARSPRASWISMSLPYYTDPGALGRLLEGTVDRAPTLSASAGYRLSWDRSQADLLAPRFTALAKRFLGLDVSDPDLMAREVALEGVVTVNWLTFVGDPLLEAAGAPPPAPEVGARRGPVAVTRRPHGLLVTAGDEPSLGDVNQLTYPETYASAARLLEPFAARRVRDYWPSAVGTDAVRRWLRRFSPPEEGAGRP